MRSYEQLCALSKALDVVGGRWTLLIVRELLIGPRRFSDLRAALPGIANNLLADRLRELESEGLVRRRALGPPGTQAAAQGYELTPRGQELDQVVFALMRWGAEYMAPRPEDSFRPEWLTLVLRAYLPARVPRDARVRARIDLGEAALLLDASDGTPHVEPANADVTTSDDAVTVEADPYALLAVASGAETLRAARRRGAVRVTGDRDGAQRLERLFAAISPR